MVGENTSRVPWTQAATSSESSEVQPAGSDSGPQQVRFSRLHPGPHWRASFSLTAGGGLQCQPFWHWHFHSRLHIATLEWGRDVRERSRAFPRPREFFIPSAIFLFSHKPSHERCFSVLPSVGRARWPSRPSACLFAASPLSLSWGS